MTHLDLPTISVLTGLICATMGLVMLGLRHNLSSQIGGLGWWGLAPLLGLASTVFYELDGSAPAAVVSLGGNTLVFASAMALLAGSFRFFGQRLQWLPWLAWSVGCLGANWFFLLAWPDYRWRVLVFTVGVGALWAAHAHILWRRGTGFGARLTLGAVVWQTAVLALRAATSGWIDTAHTQRFEAVSFIQTLYLGTFGFTTLLVLVGVQLMASERLRRELEHLARHDDLTGVLNRRAILALVQQEHERWQRYGQPYALMLLDIDHFKRINDTHGHQAGDHTLERAARTLQQGLRAVDKLGRYGGEEFIVLLPSTNPDAALAAAERLRAALAQRPSQHGLPACTASIGVTITQTGDASPGALLSRADAALYRAKDAGRNRVMVG